LADSLQLELLGGHRALDELLDSASLGYLGLLVQRHGLPLPLL